jgi:phage I-like protein
VAVIRGTDRKLTSLHSVALTNKPAIVGATAIVNRRIPVIVEQEASADSVPCYGAADEAGDEEELVAASMQVRLLREELRRRDVDALILKARKSGRLIAAHESWARRLIAADVSLFAEWLGAVAPVVPLGRLVAAKPADTGSELNRLAAQRARQEFRSHPEISMLTSEAAYVSLAMRDAT